jgi:hypothetical protein
VESRCTLIPMYARPSQVPEQLLLRAFHRTFLRAISSTFHTIAKTDAIRVLNT